MGFKMKKIILFCVVNILFIIGTSSEAQIIPVALWNKKVATCGGVKVGGYCWYYGNDGQSCATVCSARGGYNSATQSYAGNTGTNANCNTVLTALAAGGGTSTADSMCNAGLEYAGCVIEVTFVLRGRCTNAATNASAAVAGYRRACACNN